MFKHARSAKDYFITTLFCLNPFLGSAPCVLSLLGSVFLKLRVEEVVVRIFLHMQLAHPVVENGPQLVHVLLLPCRDEDAACAQPRHPCASQLVGYTNVGKSTIMNLLSKSEVFAENKLFATLDTTVRKVVVENLPFLLADTVGFIRKLPTDLVDSFKSTLDETREADLLLHVVDISHPDFEEQIQVVEKTLKELGCADKPSMIIFNKIDNYSWVEKEEDDLTPIQKENITLDELKHTWMAKLHDDCLFISAKNKENIDEFRDILYKKVRELHVQKYPYNDFLYQDYE